MFQVFQASMLVLVDLRVLKDLACEHDCRALGSPFSGALEGSHIETYCLAVKL